MQISEQGNFKLLVKRGIATDEQCLAAWEKIVQANEKAVGKNQFMSYMELSQSYLALIHEHQFVKLILMRLSLAFDNKLCEELKGLGYNLNLKPDKYRQSLSDCMNNSNNLITQILLKRKELEKVTEENKDSKVTFEDAIAETSFHVGFELKNDITLAQFNAYRKTIEKKNKNNGRRKSREIPSD